MIALRSLLPSALLAEGLNLMRERMSCELSGIKRATGRMPLTPGRRSRPPRSYAGQIAEIGDSATRKANADMANPIIV
jgi:hypothetical protein